MNAAEVIAREARGLVITDLAKRVLNACAELKPLEAEIVAVALKDQEFTQGRPSLQTMTTDDVFIEYIHYRIVAEVRRSIY